MQTTVTHTGWIRGYTPGGSLGEDVPEFRFGWNAARNLSRSLVSSTSLPVPLSSPPFPLSTVQPFFFPFLFLTHKGTATPSKHNADEYLLQASWKSDGHASASVSRECSKLCLLCVCICNRQKCACSEYAAVFALEALLQCRL
jgi:hypothetical protein